MSWAGHWRSDVNCPCNHIAIQVLYVIIEHLNSITPSILSSDGISRSMPSPKLEAATGEESHRTQTHTEGRTGPTHSYRLLLSVGPTLSFVASEAPWEFSAGGKSKWILDAFHISN